MKLIEEEYDNFEVEFNSDMKDKMKGTDDVEKLERAWRIYSRWRLTALGFGDEWKRAYLELDEFDLFMGSFSVFHFGARFPLFFGDDALLHVPADWYNLRLHLYSGDKDVPAGQSNVRLRGYVVACIIALATLNLSTAVQAVGVKAPGRSFIAIRSIRMAARSMKQLIESISRNENDFPIK